MEATFGSVGERTVLLSPFHGTEMPGLTGLREHGGRITLVYAATADGGRITYTTTVPDLRDALHVCFDAQVGDHGEHATR